MERKPRKTRMITVALLAIGIMVLGSFSTALAEFPEKPIEMIVMYRSGGTVDLTARILAKHAEKYLGQKIIIINKTGGGGSVGFTAGANAKPDGYTLTMGCNPYLQHKHLLKGVTYGADSFVPIIMVCFDPNMFNVRVGGPADMPFPDLIEYAKKNPDEILMGVGGHWASHDIARAELEMKTGAEFKKVAFRGGAGVTQALLGGHVDCGFHYLGEFAGHLDAGKLKVLAVPAEERSPFLPDVPTFEEFGIDMRAGVWRGPIAPKGTPQDRIDILAEAFGKTVQDEAWRNEMLKARIPIVIKKQKEFAKIIQEDAVKYKKIAEKLKAEGKD